MRSAYRLQTWITDRPRPWAWPALAGATLALVAPSAYAEPALSADYELLGSTDLADGSTRATIAFTFTNAGDVAFDDLFVEWVMALPHPLFEPAAPVAVGAVAPGEGATVEVALHLLGPLPEDVPLGFAGHAEDGDVIVPVDTTSTEVAP